MTEVVIYRTTYCGYCDMAKRLLQNMDVPFEEVDVTHDPEMRHKLVELTGGRRTVPQIFIGGVAVGGYTDLATLQRTGELDTMLGR